MPDNISRIKFYGVNDMSTGLHLAEAETKLAQLDLSQPITDINDALELFNIIEMFKTDVRLTRWSDETYAALKKRSLSIMEPLGRFFSALSNENILDELSSLDYKYNDDFWALFSFFSLFKRISCDTINSLLLLKERHIRSILKHSSLVQFYSEKLAEFLMEYEQSAELLISEFLSQHDTTRAPLYMPSELTFEKREILISDFIASADPNPNFLKLLYESRSNKLPLSIKTKLAAQKRYDVIIRNLYPSESDYGIQFSFEIKFDPEFDEPIKSFDFTDGNVSAVYGQKWIDDNLDFPTLWNNFIYMFNFVDHHFRCQFVSNPNKQSVLEKVVGVRGCSTYFLGTSEQFTNTMYSLMLLAYQHSLELRSIQLESMFSWFFDKYISEEFHISGFIFNPPSKGSTDLEKCKILATEIDSVLKQFELYSHEREIDRDLFEINSDSLKFRSIPSLITNKYFYSASDECIGCMNCLFSDQSTLAFTERHEDKYSTFFELMRNEKVNLSDIQEYNAPLIDLLIKKKCIQITDSSDIEFCNRKVAVLRDLFNNQYCCTSYLLKYADEIRDLYESHDIQYASTLFSEPEQNYLSYMLTKSDFSNGLDLRNKYVHGNYPSDSTQHGKDYLELLKVLIIIVIKINEEFCLQSPHTDSHNS